MGLKFDMFFLAIILRSNCSVNSWRPFHCDWIFRKDMKRYEKIWFDLVSLDRRHLKVLCVTWNLVASI